ncbi:protein MTSS 1 [Cottoperca gobio]|uniref:Protein MTSS 1 n=1 Tax=Cottoperca gobio TaxID=56716 RepID=A0A6J2PNF3_COTGO|nr:protein MTSS 1-like [Cottoperca gobio]
MDAGIEKECSALGGLFQLIMNDMKASYPTWEDFVTKGAKLQSQLRTTIVVTGAFLDAFQKVADMATGTRGATKEIGSALTRMCMRHRSIESKLKLFTTALSEGLVTPLELKMEEWKKVASQLDKDHAKEYKKARADIKKKSSDTIKLQKKMKKVCLFSLCLFSLVSLSLSQSCSARDQLALTLGALNSDAPRSSRDSLHCSSGYSTQTTTPSCSEDTIHTHTVKRDPPIYVDYESISLHGDADSISLHHLSHGNSQSDFDKSSTIPRNSDLSFQYRKFAQSKRPASTVSLLAEPEFMGMSARQLPSHTATIRRKPSSKPAYRRGTISGGVPIPICTPQVPLKAMAGNGGSDEHVFTAPSAVGAGGLGFSKLCTSTQSLCTLPPHSSPYYQLVPGQMPIPVPIPTVPSLPPEGGIAKQRQYQQQLQEQQQINQQNHHQQRSQLQQHNQQLQIQQQQLQHQQQFHNQQQLLQQPQQLQHQHDLYQEQLSQQQKQQLYLQQHQLQAAAQELPSSSGLSAHYQPQAPPPSSPEPLTQEGGGNMLNQIRGVKLKRTLTNDRSAPLLPPPTNHK